MIEDEYVESGEATLRWILNVEPLYAREEILPEIHVIDHNHK